MNRTRHTVEFTDGAFGLKLLTLDGEEVVNVRSTMITSFTHTFQIDNKEFWVKKEDEEYDLYSEDNPNAGLRVLAVQAPRVVGKASQRTNPFEEPSPKPKEDIWSQFGQKNAPVAARKPQSTNPFEMARQEPQQATNPWAMKQQPVVQQKPQPQVNLLELDNQKGAQQTNMFVNPFETKSTAKPKNDDVFDFVSEPINKNKTVNDALLGFDDLKQPIPQNIVKQSPVQNRTPIEPNWGNTAAANPTFDQFGNDTFDSFGQAANESAKPQWTGFKQMEANTKFPEMAEGSKRKLKIFDNAPAAAPPKPEISDPFKAFNAQQNAHKQQLSNGIFDEAADNFKDATLVSKGGQFETRFSNKNAVAFDDLVAAGNADPFDIELERNKKENENKNLGRYDIDPEEKVGEIIEGMQGFAAKTAKFLGKIE